MDKWPSQKNKTINRNGYMNAKNNTEIYLKYDLNKSIKENKS